MEFELLGYKYLWVSIDFIWLCSLMRTDINFSSSASWFL